MGIAPGDGKGLGIPVSDGIQVAPAFLNIHFGAFGYGDRYFRPSIQIAVWNIKLRSLRNFFQKRLYLIVFGQVYCRMGVSDLTGQVTELDVQVVNFQILGVNLGGSAQVGGCHVVVFQCYLATGCTQNGIYIHRVGFHGFGIKGQAVLISAGIVGRLGLGVQIIDVRVAATVKKAATQKETAGRKP